MKLAALILAAAGMCVAAADVSRNYTGTITDAMCSGDHSSMGGTDAAKCTMECVKSMGSKYALQVGKDSYVLSDQKTPEKFAGKKVTVTGTLNNNKELQVQSIAPAK
jgi:uncharacterized membrane protein YcgQ (UPF0703/DUF1980 family)